MKLRLGVFLSFILIIAIECSPVSHILVGEMRSPITPMQVKVFADFPEHYEKVAIIEAGSDFALKDPAILFTHQDKTDKALERLKVRAAELGANGIVIKNLASRVEKDLDVWTDDDGNVSVSSSDNIEKAVSCTAIYVIK